MISKQNLGHFSPSFWTKYLDIKTWDFSSGVLGGVHVLPFLHVWRCSILVHHSHHNFCHRVSVVRAWLDGWKLGGVFSLYNTGRRVFMSLCVCVSIIILHVEVIQRSKVCLFVSTFKDGYGYRGLPRFTPFAWRTYPYLQRTPKLWIPSAPLQWFRKPDNNCMIICTEDLNLNSKPYGLVGWKQN